MSIFANPAGNAADASETYVRNLLALLGDRNPLDVMDGHAEALDMMTRGLDVPSLRRPEKPGKWSIMQVLQHLADTEIVYGYRIRMIVAQPTPDIQGYDQDLWAQNLYYNNADRGATLEQIRVLRGANLRLIRALTETELDRFGNHSERGPESVRHIVRLIAAHDLVHQRQIKRIRTTAGA